mmetsp:Transcript_13830/g.25057  ORF Transcript_13830/g.25057 Transcript_13830/m.25057 type:complete len:112 (-) Transcript_13830:263-598(-)
MGPLQNDDKQPKIYLFLGGIANRYPKAPLTNTEDEPTTPTLSTCISISNAPARCTLQRAQTSRSPQATVPFLFQKYPKPSLDIDDIAHFCCCVDNPYCTGCSQTTRHHDGR